MTEKEKKEEGMQRSEDAASAEWKGQYVDGLFTICVRQQFFTNDDIWDLGISSSKASGPILRRAARQGLIRKTGKMKTSTRRHQGDMKEWESLVYEE